MSKPEIYCDLRPEDAIDTEGKNISHPRLRAAHLAMVPFLRVIDVVHFDYEHEGSDKLVLRQGQIVGHRDMYERLTEIFAGFLEFKFSLSDAIPISQAPDSQDAFSMARNRTVAYRPDVIGDPNDPNAPFSEHLRGAVDLSPLDSPIINPDFTIEPPEAVGRLPRLGRVLSRRPDVGLYLKYMGYELGHDWDDPRAGEGFYGVNRTTGEPKHILRDQHHIEPVPSLAAQVEMPHLV